jgi:hypothetical protein
MSFLVRATMISLTRNLTYLPLTPDLSQQHRFSSARSSSDALNRNPKTKSLTFSADISHGLRDAMPGPRRYRLKLTSVCSGQSSRKEAVASIVGSAKAHTISPSLVISPSLLDPFAVTLKECS